MKSQIRFARDCPSPVGVWTIMSDGESIVGIYSARHRHAQKQSPRLAADAVCKEATRQMAEYFAGTRKCFDLPLEPAGTDFDRRVWNALVEIPFGTTSSYGELARRIGSPTAARAVGAANGRNPISLVIPCHRVIGANGRYVGYGGGIGLKAWLLAHEGAVGKRTIANGPRSRANPARADSPAVALR
jgi:methylated-DNA-[protein]-cysteine S-methyltransferase